MFPNVIELGNYIIHALSRKKFLKKKDCMYVFERKRKRGGGEAEKETDSVPSVEPTGSSSLEPETKT